VETISQADTAVYQGIALLYEFLQRLGDITGSGLGKGFKLVHKDLGDSPGVDGIAHLGVGCLAALPIGQRPKRKPATVIVHTVAGVCVDGWLCSLPIMALTGPNERLPHAARSQN